MRKLIPKIAEEFAKKQFEKISNEEDREFKLFHSKSVGDTAILIANGKNVDKDLLKIAGWLHDIGQTVSMDNHAQHSLDIITKEFVIDEQLKDCILNHGNNGKPRCEEAKLINLADKISTLNPSLVTIFMKYSSKKTKEEKQKDIDFIKMMVSRGINLLEKT